MEVSLKVNAEITKYTFMSHHQNAEHHHWW
jgi:hypothetical protein